MNENSIIYRQDQEEIINLTARALKIYGKRPAVYLSRRTAFILKWVILVINIYSGVRIFTGNYLSFL
jgi:hypothetical protein